MTVLLDKLRDDALQLIENELPSAAEVRPLLGALVKRLEQIGFADQLDKAGPAPVADRTQTTVEPGVYEPPAPAPTAPAGVPAETAAPGPAAVSDTAVADLQTELAAAQAKIAQLEAEQGAVHQTPDAPAADVTPPPPAPAPPANPETTGGGW